jgi:hypothetical protein
MYYTVAIFPLEQTGGCSLIAYLRDYNPDWKGCCLHKVQEKTGGKAKQAALKEHKKKCIG